MNGAQDLGGMMGFGPVIAEAGEPPFHEQWERRVFALTLAMGFTGQWNIDMSRAARESLPPPQYLASSYYEIWFAGLERLIVSCALAGEDELAAGRSLRAPRGGIVPLARDDVAAALARGGPSLRPAQGAPAFAVGDPVRTLEINPSHHTRLPRYARAKRGWIAVVHGAHVFPDCSSRGLGEQPQWLYTVRFDANELWGEHTTASSVCVDCWEPHLVAE